VTDKSLFRTGALGTGVIIDRAEFATEHSGQDPDPQPGCCKRYLKIGQNRLKIGQATYPRDR